MFFSAVSLLDHAGQDYEPFIFAALNSAKAMIVVGTSAENINAKWVRNEWGRYFKLCRNDKTRILIVCYKEMKASQLPAEFANLEALDMNNVGFLEPLTRRINEYVIPNNRQEQKQGFTSQNTVGEGSNGQITALLERVSLFLEDGKWTDANNYCERVLDIVPRNAKRISAN